MIGYEGNRARFYRHWNAFPDYMTSREIRMNLNGRVSIYTNEYATGQLPSQAQLAYLLSADDRPLQRTLLATVIKPRMSSELKQFLVEGLPRFDRDYIIGFINTMEQNGIEQYEVCTDYVSYHVKNGQVVGSAMLKKPPSHKARKLLTRWDQLEI